ncbi:MAG: hypothetical protein R3251_04640 [Candidatus Spechtbacterales bacterium]|nr:hypothetical protein [Candidatus Spechtbacterales bacterium]
MGWFMKLIQSIVFQTVVSGVFVFIISQLVFEIVIKPIRKFKATILKVGTILDFYSNVIVNPPLSGQLPEDYMDAKKSLREVAFELEAAYKNIPLNALLARIPEKAITHARKGLIFLSNIVGHPNEKIPVDGEKKKSLSLVASDKTQEVKDYINI